MLQLQIGKSEEEKYKGEKENSLDDRIMVTNQILEPSTNSNRIIFEDFYFALVESMNHLYGMGLHLIAVVKSSLPNFPAKYLGSVKMD